MPVTAKLRYLRIAPRKVRLVVDLIRGKSVEEARTILTFTTKRAAKPLLKLLNTAVADAKNNFQLDTAGLFISKITVDEGPKYKRWRARARGRAAEIQKKTSHIAISLEPSAAKPKKIAKIKTEKIEEEKKTKKKENPPAKKTEKPKFKPEIKMKKPKTERGLRRIFKRKAF
jgi:large subunit ribosomal protein L22